MLYAQKYQHYLPPLYVSKIHILKPVTDLYMSFISVDGTGELGFLAHGLGEYDDLLEEEDGHLLHLVVGRRGRVVRAEQRTS